jgi:hypothetical protein
VKYCNDKHFFKILSESAFEELSVFFMAYSITPFTAKTFVDRNLIQDLIHQTNEGIALSSQQEYDKKVAELETKDWKKLA